MICRGVEFARDERGNPVREPRLANLVVPARVQELRELVSTASKAQ